MEQFAVNYTPNHLCPQCKFQRKCPRYKQIVEKLKEVEVNALSDWKLDVSIFLRVEDCDLYKFNWESVQVQVVVEDDDEDYEEEDGDDE